MAIEKDIATRTAISVDYTRTGNTLNRRERHAVKDADGNIFITFDETTQYQGQDALAFLDGLTSRRDSNQINLDRAIERNDAYEEDKQSDITFQTDQINEIEALL